MNCTEVAAILDTHRSAHLAAAERAAVDLHLSECDDCAAAWLAQTELLALRVPPMPATLPARALLASRAPQSAEARRARMPIVIGSVLLAGAAASAVTIVSMTREQSVPTVSAAAVEPSAASAAPGATLESVTRADEAPATTPGDGVTSVELVETALSVAPLVRPNPRYPARALGRGMEGHVQVKFDVTAAGVVENVTVVESSDALFEDPAVEAVTQWRYLPRILAGKRVASEGIRTVIRFALEGDETPPNPLRNREAEQAQREYLVFSEGLRVALDRLAADDLRGAELQLDEVQAVHGASYGQLWNFYGYLFTVQGNYDRAIDSYETAVSAFARNGTPREAPYVPLANLYFARNQYDMALKTLLRPNLPGGNRVMSPEADALAQKLNALGVTETLQ